MSEINKHQYIFFPLLSAVPLSLLLGSAVINIILISICLILIILESRNVHKINKDIFLILFIFWISIIINSLFSSNFLFSIERSIGFLRHILLVLFVILCFHSFKKKILNFFFTILTLLFFFITFDLIYEFFVGKNLLGYQASYEGRLASVLGEELKIGNFFAGFAFIVLAYIYKEFSNMKLISCLFILFFIISFLIGERANFIKFFLISIILIFYLKKFNLKYIFFTISTLVVSIFLLLCVNNNLKNKYVDTFITPVSKSENINNLLKNTHHGVHLITAYNIFKENYIFGSGIKTFRIECKKKKYDIKDSPYSHKRCSTHPHQYHFEFLSEAGLFGYIFFLLFFIMSFVYFFKQNKKPEIYQIAGAMYVFINILPLIPSGSFFTTFSSTIFWFNYALMFSKRT